MNLIARGFERRARALHRAARSENPALLREFRQQRRRPATILGRNGSRFALPLLWAWLFVLLIAKQRSLALPLGIINIWAAGTALGWGHRWFQQFYASEDLLVLNHLPLDDRQIFRFQLRRYLRSAGWVFWEMLLAYGVMMLLVRSGGPPLIAFPLAAVLQTLLILALALHAASRLHMLPLGTISGLFRTTAIMLLVLGAQDLDFIRLLLQGSDYFLPSGWVNYMLVNAPADPASLALLLPVFAIIYLARYSFARLSSFYSLEGIEIMPSPSAAPPRLDDEEISPASFRKPGPTEIEDHIAARAFLQGVNWETAGPIERWIARLLDARERVITEFLVAQNPGWTGALRWSFWIWLLMSMLTLSLGQFGGAVVFFAAYVLAAATLPLFGGRWRGIRQIASGSVFLPGFALYPITFNSIAAILLKVNLARTIAGAPFLISFGAIAAFKLNSPPVEGAMLMLKLIAILIVAQPLFILFPISSSTNDTSRLRALWWVLVFAPLLVLIMLAAAGVFLCRTAAGVLGCYAAIFLVCGIAFLLYRRAYRVGRFDLLAERSKR